MNRAALKREISAELDRYAGGWERFGAAVCEERARRVAEGLNRHGQMGLNREYKVFPDGLGRHVVWRRWKR